MRILSKRKDYYDQVGNIYGVDEKVIFDRNKKLPAKVRLVMMDEAPIPLRQPVTYYQFGSRFSTEFLTECQMDNIQGFTTVSVCGKPFIVAKKGGIFEGHEYIEPYYEVPSDTIMHLGFSPNPYAGKSVKYLERIHKEIGSPIFMLWNFSGVRGSASPLTYDFTLSDRYGQLVVPIPILDNIKGFAKLYPAEQLYQDISYWISNVLNVSPDVQPEGAPPQTDKEKIVAHGLDLKKSFRHRS